MSGKIDADFVRGLAMVDDKMLVLLDVPRLISDTLVDGAIKAA
jgi:chemotaxis signal transduction protein